MSRQDTPTRRAVRGTIRRRLLVNPVVDPDEAARRLPAGLHPHVTPLGTVVGCCLLEIDRVRPAYLPASAGVTLRAGAHRISVEWLDEAGRLTAGVYVPMRQTDSRIAAVLGGRWFPGVHESAHVEASASDTYVRWVVDPRGPEGYRVHVSASIASDAHLSAACEPVAGTCVSADVASRSIIAVCSRAPAWRRTDERSAAWSSRTSNQPSSRASRRHGSHPRTSCPTSA